MSFHFLMGTGRGKVPARTADVAHKIAKAHGACFTSVRLPGDGYRHWFTLNRSYGCPFDDAKANAVREAVKAKGIELP